MKWVDQWLGKSALSRVEKLTADKLDEIARVKRAQFADELSIQKRIDDVDTQIADLKRKRKRIEAELATARETNQRRTEQHEAELKELQANAAALQQADVTTPATKTMIFRAGE
jgi:TolA-binding protein